MGIGAKKPDPSTTIADSTVYPDALHGSSMHIPTPLTQPDRCSQPITGADADELVAEYSDEKRGSLFRLEGSGAGRQAVVTSARGNEHQLEKVTCTPHCTCSATLRRQ